MKHQTTSDSFEHVPDTDVDGGRAASAVDLLDELEAIRQADLPPRIAILGLYDLLLSDVTLQRTLSGARLWALAERLVAPEEAGNLTVALLYEAIVDGAETVAGRVARAALELREAAEMARTSPMSEDPWLPLGLVQRVDVVGEGECARIVCRIDASFDVARLSVIGAARAFLASVGCGAVGVDVVADASATVDLAHGP